MRNAHRNLGLVILLNIAVIHAFGQAPSGEPAPVPKAVAIAKPKTGNFSFSARSVGAGEAGPNLISALFHNGGRTAVKGCCWENWTRWRDPLRGGLVFFLKKRLAQTGNAFQLKPKYNIVIDC